MSAFAETQERDALFWSRMVDLSGRELAVLVAHETDLQRAWQLRERIRILCAQITKLDDLAGAKLDALTAKVETVKGE